MTLPGFTAEASLLRTDLHHRETGVTTSLTDNRQVIPQLLGVPRLLCAQVGTLVDLTTGAVERMICCRGLGGGCFFVK